MNSLFLKIFLWFWGAMTIAIIAIAISDVQRAEQASRRWQRITGDAFSVYAESAADAHVDQQTWAAEEYLADLEKRTRIRAWLFDESGREVASHAARPTARSEELEQQIQTLIARTRQSKHTEFAPLGAVILAARQTTPYDGQQYILYGELPRARFGAWEAEPNIQFLRLLAVLLTAGAACWGLGRYLTGPIITLREATRRMAAGDLGARPGTALGKRRDELADLSRDFDRMAERIESLLEEQNRILNTQRQLLGDVSHELRSPLARVGIAVELAREHLKSENQKAVTETLDRIERETARQSEMVDRLLMLTRLESGLQERGNSFINLTEVLRLLVADANYEAQSNHRAVRLIHSDDAKTFGTPDLIRSGLENVIRNAVRYTRENTEVEVALICESHSMAVIRVRDFGPGVPEPELQNIFRPFYRAETARDRKRGGTGLGLTIAARAIELHGGSVVAMNAGGASTGLIIEIRLPVSDTKQAEYS